MSESPTTALARVIQPLEPGKASLVREAFGAVFDKISEWEQEAQHLEVTSEEQTGKMARARSLRLELRKVRVALDKKRKAMKEGILLESRAIDGAFAVFEGLVDPMERWLTTQEQFAETRAKSRQDALASARAAALTATGMAAESLPAALGTITEDAFALVLWDAQTARDARVRIAKEEEEAKVEAARLLAEKRAAQEVERKAAEAARLVREQEQAAEVERLKAEAVERERAAETGRLAREKRHEAELEVLRAQEETMREARARDAQAETERLAAIEAKVEQQKAELRAIEAREAAKRQADEAEAERMANAGARERLVMLAANLRDAKLPDGQTKAETEIIGKVRARLAKLAADIELAAKRLS